jgi:PilZ domain.
MRDFSESGLFLLYPKDLGLEKGAIVEVQTLEFEDAPIQSCKVVRIEPGIGIAVEFV